MFRQTKRLCLCGAERYGTPLAVLMRSAEGKFHAILDNCNDPLNRLITDDEARFRTVIGDLVQHIGIVYTKSRVLTMPPTHNATNNPSHHMALAALRLQHITLQALALHFTIMAYAQCCCLLSFSLANLTVGTYVTHYTVMHRTALQSQSHSLTCKMQLPTGN